MGVTYTYTFVNGNLADADEVNQNFTDVGTADVHFTSDSGDASVELDDTGTKLDIAGGTGITTAGDASNTITISTDDHSHESAGVQGGKLDLFAAADATTKERYLAINPSAFIVYDSTKDSSLYDNKRVYNNTGNTQAFHCPINLPHGAIVTKCIFYGDDAGESWFLYRNDHVGGETGMAGDDYGSEDTSISNATIDNVNYSYGMQIDLSDAKQCWGGRITYTITADKQSG